MNHETERKPSHISLNAYAIAWGIVLMGIALLWVGVIACCFFLASPDVTNVLAIALEVFLVVASVLIFISLGLHYTGRQGFEPPFMRKLASRVDLIFSSISN